MTLVGGSHCLLWGSMVALLYAGAANLHRDINSACKSGSAGATFMTGSATAALASGLVIVAFISVGAEFESGVSGSL
jgi:hypothetical protein